MSQRGLIGAVGVMGTLIVLTAGVQPAFGMTVGAGRERLVVRGGDERDYIRLATWGYAQCPGDPPCYAVENGGASNSVSALPPCVPFRRFSWWQGALCPRSGISRIAIFGRGGDEYVDPHLGRLRVPLKVVTGPGKDSIEGTHSPDVIAAGQGPDHVIARRGADRVWGGPGRDLLRGEGDEDTLYGGLDRDRVVGESGSDFLFGGDGADRLEGGAGFDHCDGGGEQDAASFCEVLIGIP